MLTCLFEINTFSDLMSSQNREIWPILCVIFHRALSDQPDGQ